MTSKQYLITKEPPVIGYTIVFMQKNGDVIKGEIKSFELVGEDKYEVEVINVRLEKDEFALLPDEPDKIEPI